MQLISRFDKGNSFSLCVIDIFSKYAWVIFLKGKNGTTITNAFKKNLDEPKRKPNKIWVDKGSEFTKAHINHGYKIMTQKCIQRVMKNNLLLLKDLLEP